MKSALSLPSPDRAELTTFWRRLMEATESSKVVPIVGRELLKMKKRTACGSVAAGPEGSGSENLDTADVDVYDLLAEKLQSGVSGEMTAHKDSQTLLSQVFALHPDFHRNPYNARAELQEAYASLDLCIPEPLIQLASITKLKVFLSTTFDDLLERALNEVRFGGKKKTLVLSYAPNQVPRESAIREAMESGYPVVFHLFGSYRDLMTFAVTESDMVEYMHSLQSKERRPTRLFDEIMDRHLLLLGNSFPDWLARFFLFLTRSSEPLQSQQRRAPQYMADAELSRDPYLVFFLKHFMTMTEALPEVSAVQFVAKMHDLWKQRHPGPVFPVELPLASAPADSGPAVDAVFISYASEDAEAAQTLRSGLESVGIDVWLDRAPDGLKPGDEYAMKIERQIQRCRLFLPVLSATTRLRAEGFFRREWKWAIKRLEDFTGSIRQFVVPVVIDELNCYSEESAVPREFLAYQCTKIPGGAATPEFLGHVKNMVRQSRKEDRHPHP